MTKNKIDVYFILPTLFAGGAERVFLFASQNLDKEKFTAKLIVIGFEKDSKYNVQGVPVTFLNKKRVLNGILPMIRLLHAEKPSIVISTIAHLNVVMGIISTIFPKIKFVGRVSGIAKISTKYNKSKKGSIINKISSVNTYGMTNLDAIICQSNDMKNDFLDYYDYDENKIKIIHNPITQSSVHNLNNMQKNEVKKFFTVGRLTDIKGHSRILDMLSKLDFPFIYTIVGDGPLKDKILNQAQSLGISDSVNYIGYTDKVDDIILGHDMFLQGSYSEGFPNALLESCVLGTPVLAFNVPGGTKEIVEDGVNGFLVTNEDEFLNRLNDGREWDREAVSASVYKKFSKEKILSEYEEFFSNILTKQ